MALQTQEKIITLWIVFLLGTLFHAQLGLMPLFHGINIATSDIHADSSDVAQIFWLMLGFFTLPLLAILATAFTAVQPYRIGHFYLTLAYSVLNLLHVVLDLQVQPIAWYQITLMVMLFLVGLLLNVVAYQWMRKGNFSRILQEHSH